MASATAALPAGSAPTARRRRFPAARLPAAILAAATLLAPLLVTLAPATPAQATPTRTEPTQADPTKADPAQKEPSQTGPTQTGPTQAGPTRYPLTLSNCGRDVTFPHAPQRAVSIGQNETEIMLSLGLGDRLVGTALWVGPVLPELAGANARIPRLADNDPSFESVVGREPDLVTAQFEWHLGPHGAVGRREQFDALGIPTYVARTDCTGKDNSGSGDGVRRTPFDLSQLYGEIRDLAAIFDVQDRGEALIRKLQAREAAAVAAVAPLRGRAIPTLFWFSSRDVAGDAFVAGTNGAPAAIMRILGLRNVITTEDEWPTVGWETIAAAAPRLIVLGEMSRRRFPADDAAVKRRFLETDPVAREIPAVRAGQVITVDAQSMNPTMRTIDGIEAVARGLQNLGTAP
ncbi:ABC transporter substrate-binding protein [Roseomonas elaeocarpi]|uniref:ABC transporter substrate-binding protein n=1 Tax=Roseomonas elaeocarpi TaxID=907779 RepID=A0ABV6JPI7_9PROT